MFIGMIGYTYMVGLSSIWLMIGWIGGDFLSSLFIHKHLRVATERGKVLSFAGALSNWHGNNYRVLQFVGGLITIAFLGIYAAAQLSAGSKALHVLFGWDYAVGAIIGAIMVALYCVAGGIRASVWTDVAQSFIMIIAMAALCVMSIAEFPHLTDFVDKLHDVSPSYMSLFPKSSNSIGGLLLFILGWVFAGIGVIGQPHIMVRFMAMNQPSDIKRVRIYYYSWYSLFYLLTIGTGFAARLLLPDINNFDAELALPTLAQNLLPEILVGLVLAGLFAATMSTADSQILSCSAAITHDLTLGKKLPYFVAKITTILVTITALLIALFGSKSVFSLVLIAWSALASCFAPLLIIYAFGGKPSEKLALMMITTAISTMFIWRYFNLNNIMYEVAPAMIVGLLTYALGTALKK